MYDVVNSSAYMREKHARITAAEQRWESYELEDAEYVLCAFGLTSRVVKETVKLLRAKGERVGMIRPISLWPFPVDAFRQVPECAKGYICIEGNDCGQMIEDVALAAKVTRNLPVYLRATGQFTATTKQIMETCEQVRAGKAKEVF